MYRELGRIAIGRALWSFVLAAAGVVLCAPSTSGQECDWLLGEGIPGTNWAVFATGTWDPDGEGPEPELLIVGGGFGAAGDVVANGIAAWNGSDWQQLGSGMNGPILAQTVYNGELIAAGEFTTAGGVPCSSIARWNGSAWQPLGSGVDGVVLALTVYNGELVVGGGFTTAGGMPYSFIARWSATGGWQPLGSGVDQEVNALLVYGGELVAGGQFDTAGGVACRGVARWNGSVWQPFGSGVAHVVYALTEFNSELIAGGHFTTAGDHVSCYWARWSCPLCVGDLNCDGVIDFSDINPFVAYLSDYVAWLNQFGPCNPLNGDINGDGTYGEGSFDDINPFVDLLITGQGPCP